MVPTWLPTSAVSGSVPQLRKGQMRGTRMGGRGTTVWGKF